MYQLILGTNFGRFWKNIRLNFIIKFLIEMRMDSSYLKFSVYSSLKQQSFLTLPWGRTKFFLGLAVKWQH